MYESFSISRLSSNELLTRTTSVSRRLRENAWVTVANSSSSSNDNRHTSLGDCNHSCMIDGLNFAQILGETARKGFDVVFIEDSLQTAEQNAFKVAITMLHKKLIGSGVLSARIVKSTPDGKLSDLYAHCSRKSDGALTLMGINFSNMRTKFNVRLSTIVDPNISIVQYLLSVQNGQVLLNNENFSDALLAANSMKYKKMSKFSIPITLPPFSLAFWTLKNVKVDECMSHATATAANENSANSQQLSTISSSDKLLLSLVANEMQNAKHNQLGKRTRTKRQTAEEYLPSSTFGFPEFPHFKLPNLLMTSPSNTRPVVENFFSFNNAATHDENPFQHSDNPALPKGDVYMDIGKPADARLDSPDYTVVDEARKSQNNRKKMRTASSKTTTESPDYFAQDYADVILRKNSRKSSQQKRQPAIGELFELDEIQAAADDGEFKSDDDDRGENVELKTVIKELEPTYLQSRRALKQAKKKWDKNQIMELLKSSQVQEIDRKNLKNLENYEIIDLTDSKRLGEDMDYGEFDNDEEDEDDDGFFDSKKSNAQQRQSRQRNKRHIDVARINNRIPKWNYNRITDSSEEYASMENLESDTNDVSRKPLMQTPPASSWHNGAVSSSREADGMSSVKSANLNNNSDNSTVIKAVNFLTYSFNRALDVLDKTIVGCFKIFGTNEDFQY